MRQLKAIHDLFRFEAICSGMRQKYSGTRRVPVLGRTVTAVIAITAATTITAAVIISSLLLS